MRQRRSTVRSETTAAWLTLGKLAHRRAAIYPVLTGEPVARRSPRGATASFCRAAGAAAGYMLHPGLVRRRPVDRRDLAVRHAEVHRELAAVVDAVHQHEPQHIHLPHVTHLLRRHEE